MNHRTRYVFHSCVSVFGSQSVSVVVRDALEEDAKETQNPELAGKPSARSWGLLSL